MATIVKEILVNIPPETAWDAIRDIGALHTRLAPGFVVDTKLENEASARVVTFSNGAIVRERIVTVDDERRRLVWDASGGRTTHYNSAAQVFANGAGARIVWTSDFLPHEAESALDIAMTAGASAMKVALSKLEKH